MLLISVCISGCKKEQTPIEETILTINEVVETSNNTDIITQGTIVAINDDGFIIEDLTGFIFVKYSENFNRIKVNDEVKISGKHIFENGHKIDIDEFSLTDLDFTPTESNYATEKKIKEYNNLLQIRTHILKHVTIIAKITTVGSNFVLLMDNMKIYSNSDIEIDKELINHVGNVCAVTGYIYEHNNQKLLMIITNIEFMFSVDKPTIEEPITEPTENDPTLDEPTIDTPTDVPTENNPTTNQPTEEHTCVFTGEWKKDSTHHWHECSCGEIDTKLEHTGGEATTTELAVCEVCGQSYGQLLQPPVHECDFSGEWMKDSTHHWHKCSCGEIDEKVEHIGGKATTTELAVCEVCGQSYGQLEQENNDFTGESPVITTKMNYYHFIDIDSVGDLTEYFEVTDLEDGQIEVTNDMINGTLDEGKNIITLVVTDSNKNSSSADIIVNIGKYKGFENNETLANIDPYGLPTTGNAKVLVIPVDIGDNPATESMRNTIKKAFFGTSSDTGWESLKTYYEKSSYGKLTISGEVTPWYTAKQSQNYYATYSDEDDYIYGSTLLMEEALEYYKNTYNYSDFDSNNDGYIDAVYMIYNVPIGGSGSEAQEETYWAYTYWDWCADDRNYQSTKGYAYVFMGYDFFDEKPYYTNKTLNINCETVIHETGHLFNLEDYYDYDSSDSYNNDGGYCYADMMDANFGDHGPFSKILLNWTDPTVITESGIYQLPKFTTEGTTFVISANGKFDSIYDEYYIIDFYSLDGLNALQVPSFLGTNKEYAGVRVSLVNAKLTYEDGYYYYAYNNTDSKYKLIQMLEADYNGTFDLSKENNEGATLDDFYQIGDTFGIGSYQLFRSASGNSIPFTMEVLDLNSEYATVKIILK